MSYYTCQGCGDVNLPATEISHHEQIHGGTMPKPTDIQVRDAIAEAELGTTRLSVSAQILGVSRQYLNARIKKLKQGKEPPK